LPDAAQLEEKIKIELGLDQSNNDLGKAFELLESLPEDFYTTPRMDTPPQAREDF